MNSNDMQVPEGWIVKRLKECIKKDMPGEWGNPANNDDNDIPVLRSTNFTNSGKIDYTNIVLRNIPANKIKVKVLKKGDILLEKSGGSPKQPVGRVVFFNSKGRFLFSNFIQRISPESCCDSKYLLYKFLFEYANGLVLKFQQQTTGIINFQLSEYLLIKTPFPPLSEQKKIASILTSVDDVIEMTEAQISKLQDLKKGMMTELLTKGIGHIEFKDCPKWGISKYTTDSIPKAWKLVDLQSVAKLESGHTPSRENPNYWGGHIQWLSLHDTKVLGQRVVKKTIYSITEEGIKNSSARLLPEGTVALSRTASVGNCVILGERMATSQDFANYVCGSTLDNKYLLYLFRWMQHIWRRLSGGSTHQTVYMPDFKKLKILLPPLDEQIKIGTALDKVEDLLLEKKRKLSATVFLKKALMNDLLTGKKRVNVN